MFYKSYTGIVAVLLLLFVSMTSAQAENKSLSAQIEVANPEVFQLAQGATGTGSKMTIYNHTDNPLIIEGFDCDVFEMTMMHGTRYKSGRREMFEVETITIPAGKQLAMTPNKHHLMMFNPSRDLQIGEFLTLTLKTNQGELDVIAQVVPRHIK